MNDSPHNIEPCCLLGTMVLHWGLCAKNMWIFLHPSAQLVGRVRVIASCEPGLAGHQSKVARGDRKWGALHSVIEERNGVMVSEN